MVLACGWLGAGCQCGDLPLTDPSDDPPPMDTPPVEPTTDSGLEDTAPLPPCQSPEQEPNNSFEEPNRLVMEEQACGVFNSNVDADFWEFTLSEPTWLGVEVEAYRIGSRADVSLTLSSDDADVSLGINYHHGTPDVFVRIPSQPGDYQLMVRQTVGASSVPGEGDDFFYKLMATAAKEPVAWNLMAGDNDSREGAMDLSAAARSDEGAQVLAGMDAFGDEEWYRVDVPSGRHRLEVRVLAHEFGSIGNFLIERYDASGARVAVAREGEVGWELDPWLEHRTFSSETVYLKIVEESGQHGVPIWYVVDVRLEEDR